MKARSATVAFLIAGASLIAGPAAGGTEAAQAIGLPGAYAGIDDMGRYHMLVIGPLEGGEHPFWWGFETPYCFSDDALHVVFGMADTDGMATVTGWCLEDRDYYDHIEAIDIDFDWVPDGVTAKIGPVSTYDLERVCDGGPGENGEIGEIVGTNAADTLHGTRGNDVINSLGGSDVVYGRGGNDIICGGLGADQLYGHAGVDLLVGGGHGDTLRGGLHADALFGDAGLDTLRGQVSDDVLFGGAHNDRLNGGAAHDWLFGGLGTDRLQGGLGYDRCDGEFQKNCDA